MKTSKILKAALKYMSKGYSIFPCKPGTKEPLVKWKTFQKKHPTEKQVREWWEKGPDTNMAIVTGKISKLFVVDIDGPEGEDFIARKGGLPETAYCKTSRGHHYYLQCPDFEVPSSTNKTDGLDIRGEGGYVIAPPSIHPDGTQYKWVKSPSNTKIAPPPVWLKEYLQEKKSAKKSSKAATTKKISKIKKNKKRWERIQKAIQKYPEIMKAFETPKPQDRSGHDWFLVMLCIENGICKNKWLYEILLRNKYGKAKTRRDREEYIANLVAQAKTVYEYGNSLISARDLMKTDFPEDYGIIAGGILNKGTLLIIGGESSTGKTTLALEFSVKLVKGSPIFGLSTLKCSNVVMLQQETNLAEIKFRMGRITAGLGISKSKLLRRIFFSEPRHSSFDLGQEGDVTRIISLLQATKAEVLIIDPLICFHSVDENNNVSMRHILNQITRIIRETDAAAIMVHHYGKSVDRSGRHRLRGASAIFDAADTVIGLATTKNTNIRQVEFQKIRNGRPREKMLIEVDDHFLHSIVTETGICPTEKVVKIMKKTFSKGCGKKGDLAKQLADDIGCDTKTAGKAIDAAERKGLIKIYKKGRCKPVKLINK